MKRGPERSGKRKAGETIKRGSDLIGDAMDEAS